RVSWRVVGDDAHPVIGAFVIGVKGFAGAEQALPEGQLGRAIGELGGSVGEGRTGSAGLAWAIRGGRSLEIVLLYVVLGILLLRTLVLHGRLAPAPGGSGVSPGVPGGSGVSPGVPGGSGVSPGVPGPGATTAAALEPDRGYRTMLRVGIVASVAMPLLFALYVARLQSAVGGVSFGDVIFSSLGQTWTIKTVLWLGIVAACVYGLRRHPAGSRQHDVLVLSLAAAAAVAFGYNTHAIGESPRLVWGLMMWGHLMVTALWAGGLVALLLLVFPTRDPARIWRSVGRFSTIMTVTVGAIIGSGLLMLLRLSGSWKSLWCSDFGVVAGFKMAVVGLALVIGLVNNRMVAYQKQRIDAPASRFRPRRERSVGQLRRLIVVEAVVLGSAVLLSGALGETELPQIFQGKYFPIDLQETVSPGLFGSGCQ
ncbi:MAG: CopD family protein, partial [Acidimicrobiia bacterium]